MTNAGGGLSMLQRKTELVRAVRDKPTWTLQQVSDSTGMSAKDARRALSALQNFGYVETASKNGGVYILTDAGRRWADAIASDRRV